MNSNVLLSHLSIKPLRKNEFLVRGLLVFFSALMICVFFTSSANAGFVRNAFEQCSNENNTLGQCVWIVSNAQDNNSLYIEGMVLAQRMMWDGVTDSATAPVTTHVITWTTQWTKGSKHAYDFVTSYSDAQQTSLAIGGFGLTMNECADLPTGGGAPTMPTECATIRAGTNHLVVTVPDDSYVSGQCDLGLCNTQDRIDAFETEFGNRTIDIWTDQPLDAVNTILTQVHKADCTAAPILANGADSGDTEQCWTLTVVPANTANPPTIILVETGGHIADGFDPIGLPGVGWGGQFSSGNISGSPYHFRQPFLDGGGGSQDNQLNASAIPNRPISLVTQLSATSITSPATVTDTATATGDNTLGPPNGTIYFYVCGPTVTPTACPIGNGTTGTGTQVGSAVTLVAGAGNTSTATSASFQPTQNGYWCFSVGYLRSNTDTAEYSNETSTSTTNECVLVSGVPTAANLLSFKARRSETSVNVKWETGSEVNMNGFNVWRKKKGGEWKMLNKALIAAQYAGQVTGGKYSYLDATAKSDPIYKYKLEVVTASNASEWSDVVKVK